MEVLRLPITPPPKEEVEMVRNELIKASLKPTREARELKASDI
jgi:hypothetical protein